MADNKVDGIILEIEATTDKADKGLDKTIENLERMKKALSGMDTKQFKKSLDDFAKFEERLRGAFSNIKIGGSAEELRKQISQAEGRLDSLLKKENKLTTVSGIDKNSKQYRNLQYDIAETCATLDSLYGKMESMESVKPLNFWEKPNWQENLTKYGTTDENMIPVSVAGNTDTLTSASQQLKDTFASLPDSLKQTESTLQGISGEVQKVNGETAKTGNILEQIKGAFSTLKASLSNSGTENFNADIQNLIDGINQAKYTMKQMESGAKEFDATAYERAAQELAAATSQMQNYKNSLLGATTETSRFKNILANIGTTIKNVFAKIGSIGSGIISACKNAIGSLRGLKNYIPKLGAAFSGLGKKIKSVTRLFTFMVLRRAITALLDSMKEGFDNLARYSSRTGSEFNKNISEMQSSLKTFGNSLVAAFEPLINVVTPILTAFIQKLISATNVIGQFFAALTGKNTYTKAKKVVGDYAAGLDKATNSAKKLASATSGIDELNILSQNDSGAESDSAVSADVFETLPVESKFSDLAQKIKEAWKNADFTEIGEMLAEKINKALEGINWTKIKGTAQKIAQSIGTFINGFVGGLDWKLLGATIGEGINTGIVFSSTFLATVEWGKVGSSIAEGLNSTISTIDWKGLGSVVLNGVNAIIDFIYQAANTFDFSAFGNSLGVALSTAINGINWGKGGQSVGKTITGLFDALNGFIKSTDWKSLGSGIIKAIGGFFKGINWGTIANTLSSACMGLLDTLTGAFQAVDWTGLPGYIVESIGDFFESFDWSGVSSSLGELLGSAVKGAVDLVGSIWDMLKDAWGNLSEYFNTYIEEAGGDIIAGLWNGITDALTDAGTWIKDNIFTPFIDGFKEAFGIASPSKEMKIMGGFIVDGLTEGIRNKFSECMATVQEWAADVKEWFFGSGDLKDKFVEFGSSITTGFKNKVNTTYTNARDTVTAWATKVKEWFNSSSFGGVNGTTFATYANDVVISFKDKVGSVYTTVRGNVTAWASDIKNHFAGAGNGAINATTFSNYASNIVSGFREKIGSTYTTVRTYINTWASDIKDKFSGHGNINATTFSTYASDVVNGFRNKILSFYTTSRAALTTWASDIKTTFKNSGASSSTFYNIASEVVNGFKNGIGALYDTCKDTIKSWGSDIISWFKGVLGIQSPSRVFREMGVWSVKGFNNGFSDFGKTTKGIVDDWAHSFSDTSINMGARLFVDNSALKDMQINYGADFSNDVITRTVQKEIYASGSFRTTIESNSLGMALESALTNVLSDVLQDISSDVRRQADKKEQTIVQIAGRTITDAVTTQQRANGYAFT